MQNNLRIGIELPDYWNDLRELVNMYNIAAFLADVDGNLHRISKIVRPESRIRPRHVRVAPESLP
jgi:hypothetical protein